MNVLDLQKVAIADIKQLPSIPGVYFVVNQHGETLYVGQSVNIKYRWHGSHHRHVDIAKEEAGVFVAWVACNKDELVEKERYFIETLKPSLNGVNHGGPRPRSGRPPGPHPGAAHRKGRLITLSDTEYEQAKILGMGNASAGIRYAIDVALTAYNDMVSGGGTPSA